MRIVITEFISLDGVVQAPGGPDEDPDRGFAHGGWSGPYFDPEVMGPAFDDALTWTNTTRIPGDGGGKSIFPADGALRPLELVSSATSGTGVHVCTYRPAAPART